MIEDVKNISAGTAAVGMVTTIVDTLTSMFEPVRRPRSARKDSVQCTAAHRVFVGLRISVAKRGAQIGKGRNVDHVVATGLVASALVAELLEEGLTNPLGDGSLKALQLAVEKIDGGPVRGVDNDGSGAIILANVVGEAKDNTHATEGVRRALSTVVILLSGKGVQGANEGDESLVGSLESAAGAEVHSHASGAPRVGAGGVVQNGSDDLGASHAAVITPNRREDGSAEPPD